MTVTFDVTNTGNRPGDEVRQLYVRHQIAARSPYDKLLRGFQRVPLAPGETKTVTFTLGPDELQTLDRDWHRVVEPGTVNVMVGGSSEDLRLRGSFEIVEE